jgi:outer membrane immunogenic protein
MIKLAHVAVISLALAGSAMAADMRRPAPVKAPGPAPVATYNWSGCYVGAGGGYGMWNQDTTILDTGVPDFLQTTSGGRGWFGTVQVGCDYQVAPAFVIGAFADYDFANIKGDFGGFPGLVGKEKLKSSWAAGGRIGYLPLAAPQLMVFLSGGYTQARFDAFDLFQFGAATPDFTVSKHTYAGWFIGSGYEYALAWFPGLTWKTEYRFADYGKENVLFTDGGVATNFSMDSHKYVHTVRSELVWRFNFGRY